MKPSEQIQVLSDALLDAGYSVKPHGKTGLDVKESARARSTSIITIDANGEVDVKGKLSDEILETFERIGLGGGKLLSVGKTGESNFEDKNDVLLEMSHALEIPRKELLITHEKGLEGFGQGTVWNVSSNANGGAEWNVVENWDTFQSLAEAIVGQDLEQEPQLFNQSFLERFINEDELRDILHHDLMQSNVEDLSYDARKNPDSFWDTYEQYSLKGPEPNEEGERRDPTETEIDELARTMADTSLESPMQWLEDVYGREEAVQNALRLAPINVGEAAAAAVAEDGAEHFLARYDGRSEKTASDFVYFRVN